MEAHPEDHLLPTNPSSILEEDQQFFNEEQNNPQNQPYIQEPIHIQEVIGTKEQYDQVFQQIEGYPGATYHVIFPYKPMYPLQKKYIRKVLKSLHYKMNALLESPTGTGKTICLLTGVLAYQTKKLHDRKINRRNQQPQSQSQRSAQQRKKQERIQKPLKIVYLSRTHVQLQQVQKELKKSPYKPTMAIFGSREQLCLKSFPQGTDKNKGCQIALALNDYSARNPLIQLTPEQIEACCSYSKQIERINQIAKRRQAFTARQIKREGLQKMFCPYFYPYKLEGADIYFMPYDYVLTPMMHIYRKYFESAIFLFDEGHNVPQTATRGRDLHFQTTEFKQVFAQILHNKELKIFPTLEQASIIQSQFNWYILKKQLNEVHTNFQTYIKDLKQQPGTFQEIQKSKTGNNYRYSYFVGSDMIPQLRKMLTTKLDTVSHDRAIQDTCEFLKQFTDKERFLCSLITALYKVIGQHSKHMKKIGSTFQRLYWLLKNSMSGYLPDLQQTDIQINHYMLLIKARQIKPDSAEADISNFVIEVVCNTPMLAIKAMERIFTPHNIIITSGTLHPLPAWTQQLGIEFLTTLQNQHIIKNYQLNIKIVPLSAKPEIGVVSPFNFSHGRVKADQALRDPKLFQNLAISINRLLQTIPGGVLIVFPNKTYLKTCVQILRAKKQDNTFLSRKHIFSEKDQRDVKQILHDYKFQASQEDGAVLCCVFRGRISEGTDLPEEQCRAVIIVGIPNIDIKAPTTKFKELYLKRIGQINHGSITSLTYDQWYEQQAARAVNQAMGRVIRKQKDYGAVFLFDSKYHYHRDWFPQWVSKSIQKSQFSFKKLCIVTKQFFDGVQQKIDRDDPQETEQQGQRQQPNRPRNDPQENEGRGQRQQPNRRIANRGRRPERETERGEGRGSRRGRSSPPEVQRSSNENEEGINGRKRTKQ